MTKRTIKIKELISGQVDMGTFGLVELELLAIEKEKAELLTVLNEIKDDREAFSDIGERLQNAIKKVTE